MYAIRSYYAEYRQKMGPEITHGMSKRGPLIRPGQQLGPAVKKKHDADPDAQPQKTEVTSYNFV